MKNINGKIESWDERAIILAKKVTFKFSRFAIFLVYFWFGALKVFGYSPASELVSALLGRTLTGVSPENFLVALGAFEVILGIMFIIPGLERLAILFLGLHLITTVMPLFLLADLTWQGFMIPTLEGQYIIKNILIIAVATGILSHLHFLKANQSKENV